MKTQPRSGRRAASGGRFSHQLSGTGRGSTAARGGVPSPPRFRRREPQKSGTARLFERLTGALPTSGRKPARHSSAGGAGKRAAGMAMLAGVAGLAYKNRERLTSAFGRDRSARASGRMEGPLDPSTGP
jgi:hypothetical protein